MSNDRIVIREPRLDLGTNREVPTNLTGEQAYDWLAIHHPKTNAAAVQSGNAAAVDRPAAVVDGELEAVRTRGDRNGIPLVMKDLILETPNGNKSVMVPSPVAGYAEFRNDGTNAISLWSKPIGSPDNELVGQVLHGARNSSPFKPGDFVPYGAPLVRQSDVGSPGAVHAHIEVEPAQFKKYLGDILSERINTQRRPDGTGQTDPSRPVDPMADGVLKHGERGESVTKLQAALNNAGIRDAQGNPLPTTGYYGDQTQAAVRKYQEQKGLEPDGKAGNDTLTALGLKQSQQTPAQPAPTQPAPTQQAPKPAQNLPADVQSAKTNIESWHLGQTSAQFETGNRGPGFISTGKGDLGGKSYGLYQLSSTQGSLAEYVGQSTKYGAEFKGLAPASAAFDAKWKEVAARDPQGFSTDQHTFIKKEFFDVQNETLKGRGVDLSDRGRAVQDMLWSTSVQYRNLTPNVVANGLKDKFGEGYQLSKLSDEQIVGAVQDYKLKRNDSLFSGSPDLWPGLRDRAKNEKTELTELARDEQTLKKAGVSVPIDLDKGPAPNAAGGRKTDPMADGVLKKGEEGPAVERLQEALNKAGIRDAEGKPLPTTGYFGDKTEAAVIKYQQQKGLEDDGKAGNDTLTALGLKSPPQQPTTRNVDPVQPSSQEQPAQQQPTQPTQQEPAQQQPTQQQPAQQQPAQQQPAQQPPTVPADQTTPIQAQPQPTQQDKPLMSNPNHPDHRLYQQALSNLEQLGPSGGFKSREDMDKAAAAVAADAKATGLKDIDHISKTSAPNGQTYLVAVQGDPTSPASKSSYIDYTQATGQSMEQSTRMSEATRQAQETPRQADPAQQQERSTSRGPAVA